MTRPAQPEPHTERRATPEQVWLALAHCYRAMSAAIEQSFVDAGLSLTDFMLLEALLHKGPLTITQIQAAALLASGSMTAAVDRLENRGLIVRTSSANDRRARLLQLTPQGSAVIQAAYDQHRNQLKQWMSPLTPGQRSSTFSSLRAIEKHLKRSHLGAPH